jgi:hypothetical protein
MPNRSGAIGCLCKLELVWILMTVDLTSIDIRYIWLRNVRHDKNLNQMHAALFDSCYSLLDI